MLDLSRRDVGVHRSVWGGGMGRVCVRVSALGRIPHSYCVSPGSVACNLVYVCTVQCCSTQHLIQRVSVIVYVCTYIHTYVVLSRKVCSDSVVVATPHASMVVLTHCSLCWW